MKHDHSAFDGGLPYDPRALDPRTLFSTESLLAASENAYPITAHRTVRKDRLGPAAGAACALLLGGVTFWSLSTHRTMPQSHDVAARPTMTDEAPAPTPAARAEAIPPYAMPSGQMPVPYVAALPTTPPPSPQPAPSTLALSAPADMTAPANAPTPAPDTGAVHRGWAPMLVVDGGSPVEDGPAAAPGKESPVTSDTATATRMSDPARTISQGTLIPAVLETAIDSDLPGYARAVVTRDVYSFDRSQVLIPRSSRLIGEYKSGLADGQKRVYVTWTRLIRPDGVSIAIASPATAPSGGTGLPGKVNGHFIQRFGSAILLTVVGAASAVGSSGLVLAGSQSAASVAASHDAQIPPTIRIRPGQPVRVFTAHDLDFSTISATPAP